MLEAVGLDWSNVAHVNSYHTPEPNGFILAVIAEVVRQFGARMPNHKPVWTCLGVACLGDPKSASDRLQRLSFATRRRGGRGAPSVRYGS